MTLNFGKFRGHKISDCPRWYLKWLSNQDTRYGRCARDVLKLSNLRLARD